MYLAIASLTLSATWIIWIWAYAAHRRPVPLAWTRYESASITVTLLVTNLLPIGIGFLVVALSTPLATLKDLGLSGAAIGLGMPLLAVLVTPRLKAPLRQGATDPAAAPAAQARARVPSA